MPLKELVFKLNWIPMMVDARLSGRYRFLCFLFTGKAYNNAFFQLHVNFPDIIFSEKFSQSIPGNVFLPTCCLSSLISYCYNQIPKMRYDLRTSFPLIQLSTIMEQLFSMATLSRIRIEFLLSKKL